MSTSTVAIMSIISIHSTTRVETQNKVARVYVYNDFNPLHHEGGDAIISRRVCQNRISIHSTTRVETHLPILVQQAACQFQSTPPRGWRLNSFKYNTSCLDFNPLHHEGGDVIVPSGNLICIYFNPLHHEGGDRNRKINGSHQTISIHSTTRVET